MARLARRPLAGVVAGVLVGSVVVAALAVRDFSPTRIEEPHGVVHSGAAAEAFLAAWEHMLNGTWVVRAVFTRHVPGRQPLVGEIHEAQRPPDRLRRGLGTIEARVNGRRTACAQPADGPVQCRDGGPAPPYEEDVAAELALLRGYVTGAGRLYDVGAENRGCFRLTLRARILAPPYGDTARLCFDAATGALRSVDVERGQARDETRAIEIRPDPTEADLTP